MMRLTLPTLQIIGSTVVGLLGATAVATGFWINATRDIEANAQAIQRVSDERKSISDQVKKLEGSVGGIKSQQQVIINNQRHQTQRFEDYIRRQDDTNRRILDKLDSIDRGSRLRPTE
jgi:predicted transcriptional regulator of viral defense system